MLNEVVALELDNLLQKLLVEPILRLILKDLPIFTLKYKFFIKANIVNTKVTKICGIVSLSYQVYRNYVVIVHKVFDVLCGNLDHPIDHEVVRVYEKLDEKLNTVLSYIEVI